MTSTFLAPRLVTSAAATVDGVMIVTFLVFFSAMVFNGVSEAPRRVLPSTLGVAGSGVGSGTSAVSFFEPLRVLLDGTATSEASAFFAAPRRVAALTVSSSISGSFFWRRGFFSGEESSLLSGADSCLRLFPAENENSQHR